MSTAVRREQLRSSQRKIREKYKTQGRRSITFYLDEETYEQLKEKKGKSSYAQVIRALLDDVPREDTEKTEDTEADRAYEMVKNAFAWINRLYPGLITDEMRLLYLLKHELKYREL